MTSVSAEQVASEPRTFRFLLLDLLSFWLLKAVLFRSDGQAFGCQIAVPLGSTFLSFPVSRAFEF